MATGSSFFPTSFKRPLYTSPNSPGEEDTIYTFQDKSFVYHSPSENTQTHTLSWALLEDERKNWLQWFFRAHNQRQTLKWQGNKCAHQHTQRHPHTYTHKNKQWKQLRKKHHVVIATQETLSWWIVSKAEKRKILSMLDHHAVWGHIKWYYVFINFYYIFNRTWTHYSHDLQSFLKGVNTILEYSQSQFMNIMIIVFCICLSVYVVDAINRNIETDITGHCCRRLDSFTTLLWVFPYFLTHTELSFGFFILPTQPVHRIVWGGKYLVCPSAAPPAYRTASLASFIHTHCGG